MDLLPCVPGRSQLEGAAALSPQALWLSVATLQLSLAASSHLPKMPI